MESRQLKLSYETAFNCAVYLGRFMMSENFYSQELMHLLQQFADDLIKNDISYE